MAYLFPDLQKRSLWALLRDARVRSGIYLWLLIAGLCVVVANAGAAGH